MLESVRQNQPAAHGMPAIPHFHAIGAGDLVATFCDSLAKMAGVVVSDVVSNLDSFLRSRYPDAKVICSSIPECGGTIRPSSLSSWSDASKIDVSVLRSPLGVAETGSVLLSDVELQVNTVAFLAHDLVVLLDPKSIVENIHEAYRHPYFRLRPYSLIMTGPSGSGDIGGVTVHPAQGVKTLTVILSPSPIPAKT
jgi:L-lactate dehydrogenase complex protein LldG